MSSIHPDYEYDIFISYRHNDNQDGWVTRFVEALQRELKATLKNEVSIYFDKNPHDGLLETHQVDASLAKKLKCLVFIPIVSQTYCDESSFAWEHELLPFVKMANENDMGINITLSNGNVTSRTLPVKIHDLDTEDQHSLEAVLDGPLRAIDFIYKEPGVNRPLKEEDDRQLNTEKTTYQNQINKVANSLKDIVTSIVNQSEGIVTVTPVNKKSPPETKSNKKVLAVGLGIIGLVMISFWIYSQFFTSSSAKIKEVRIAVLAFDDQSPDRDQEWLGDGFPDAIRDVLNNVKGLQVIGKASSQSFKGKSASIKDIGEMLNANALVGGSVSKVGNKLRIKVQLSDVTSELQVWDTTYNRTWGDVHFIMDEVAQNIISSLMGELSIEDLEDIKVTNKVNPEAYEYYLRGLYVLYNVFVPSGGVDGFNQSENMFINAISIDSMYADAYAGLADLYDAKAWSDNIYNRKRDSVANIAFNINPNSPYALMTKGLRFRRTSNFNMDSSFFFYQRAYKIDSKNKRIISAIVAFYNQIGLYKQSINLGVRLLRSDPLDNYSRAFVANSFLNLGKVDEAKMNYKKMYEIDKDFHFPMTMEDLLVIALLYDIDRNEYNRIMNELQAINLNSEHNQYKAWMLAIDGKKEEALNLSKDFTTYSLLDMKKETLDLIESIDDDRKYSSGLTYLSLLNSPSTDFIKDEPQFQVMLIRAKKVHEERVAKYGHLFDDL